MPNWKYGGAVRICVQIDWFPISFVFTLLATAFPHSKHCKIFRDVMVARRGALQVHSMPSYSQQYISAGCILCCCNHEPSKQDCNKVIHHDVQSSTFDFFLQRIWSNIRRGRQTGNTMDECRNSFDSGRSNRKKIHHRFTKVDTICPRNCKCNQKEIFVSNGQIKPPCSSCSSIAFSNSCNSFNSRVSLCKLSTVFWRAAAIAWSTSSLVRYFLRMSSVTTNVTKSPLISMLQLFLNDFEEWPLLRPVIWIPFLFHRLGLHFTTGELDLEL